MNKKERVKAAIAMKPVDHVPACFTLHFPSEVARGDAAVKAHLDFYRQTDCDALKIMNENMVPPIGELNGPADWNKVPSYTRHSPFMQAQLELIGRILEGAGDNTYSLATIHGICASAIHPLEARYGYVPVRKMMVDTFRADKRTVLDAFDRIADAMCDLAAASIEAGCTGIYYAALGGEKHFYTDEEFAECMEPFDLRIMDAARAAGGDVFLHICKENLNMERYRNYAAHCDVVNWGIYEAPLSMEAGRKLFPNKTIMGGLANRSGVLVDGTEAELQAAVRKIITDFNGNGLILGADCTLPTEIPYQRIATAVHAAVIK
ncbi:MAG: uroporphyrinogen decarboxylase family protein [Eubacteriales bacterium]|nr:uroporphyrinogen decarboxylase family protein [Eubacteriales bacterium]